MTLGGRPYLKLSGTSMAAAVTSGSVALMLEATKATFGVKPTPNAVKAMLQHTRLSDGGCRRHARITGWRRAPVK